MEVGGLAFLLYQFLQYRIISYEVVSCDPSMECMGVAVKLFDMGTRNFSLIRSSADNISISSIL